MFITKLKKNILKVEIFTFEIGNWYFNLTNSSWSYVDTNGYPLNVKIFYKFYKSLWREVKIS